MKRRTDGRYCKTKTIGGKQRFFYGDTPKEAEQKAKSYLKDLVEGRSKVDFRSFALFSDIADKWLLTTKVNIKGSTYEGYKYKVDALKLAFKGKYIQDIKYEVIEAYINNLLTIHAYSKSTIKKYRTTINSIFKYAQRAKIIQDNPCALTEVPKNATTSERRALSVNEQDLLVHSKQCTFSEFALFIYYTGLRFSEIVPLKWADIDMSNREIKVQRVVSYENGRSQIDDFLKNKDKFRIIPICDALYSLLSSMPQSYEYVFVNSHGNMMARNTARNKWGMYQQESGLVDVTPHMLRHTFATNLYYAGIDVKTIQKITGHKDISVLFNRYVHEDEMRVKSSVALMDNYFKK